MRTEASRPRCFGSRPGSEPKAVVLGNGATGQRLDWEQDGMNLVSGVFEWTPDDQRLRFCLRFHEHGGPNYWQRTGLLDLDGTARVLATSVDAGDWLRSAWSADGARGAFVLERGGAESDLFVTNAEGTDVARVTDDRTLKGDPTIDPAGRRVAFLTGETDERGRVPNPSSASSISRPASLVISRSPSPTNLRRGSSGCPAGTTSSTSAVAGSTCTPSGRNRSRRRAARFTGFRTREIGLLLDALASGHDAEVAWARHLAAQEWDPALIPALRAAVRARVEAKSFDWVVGANLLQLLFEREVREALPEMRLAARPDSPLSAVAAWMIATWMGKEALPELDVLRTKSDGYGRFVAAAAMTGLGDDRGWDTLVTASRAAPPRGAPREPEGPEVRRPPDRAPLRRGEGRLRGVELGR